MDQPKLGIVLRALLIALFATLAVVIGLAFLSDKLLPETLAEWNRNQNVGDWNIMDIAGLLFWLLGLGLMLISMLGLFFYQRWAAWMFLLIQVVFSLQVLFSPSVEPGIISFLGGWADVLTGMVVALAFFTPVLDEQNLSHSA